MRPCPWPDRTRALDGVFAAGVMGLPQRRAVRIEPGQTVVTRAIEMDEGAANVTYVT